MVRNYGNENQENGITTANDDTSDLQRKNI